MRKCISVSITLLAVFSLALISIAQGEENLKDGKEEGGMGYFMIGGGTLDIDAINTRMQTAGLSTLSDNFLSLGGGGYAIHGRLILGGEGHSLLGEEVSNESFTTSIGAGYGFFNIGYSLHSSGSLIVYPMFGIGGGAMSISMMEKGTSPSFDQILNDPKRSVVLSTGGWLINLALGTDYMFIMEENEEGKGGFILGLRIGYVLAPIKGDWSMDGIDISGGPDIGITGPYIRLMIGGGGYDER
jgi:hypothetical protein